MLERKGNRRPRCPGLSRDGADRRGHLRGPGAPAIVAPGQEGPHHPITLSQDILKGRPRGRARGAGREVPRPLHSPAPQEGQASLASAYLLPVVLLPGGGDEALWLVRNQAISDLQHENAPSPESGALGGVTHWAPCPARGGRRDPAALGPCGCSSRTCQSPLTRLFQISGLTACSRHCQAKLRTGSNLGVRR